MEYDYCVFLSNTKNEYESLNCKLIKQNSRTNLYHIHNSADSDIKSIKINENSPDEVLLKDNSVCKDIKIHGIRNKESKYEVYIYGGKIYATETKIHFFGEINSYSSLPQYKSKTKVRINNAVLEGKGNSKNDKWDWKVIDNGDAEIIKQDDKLNNILYSNNCYIIGFNSEIHTVQLCQDII